MYQDIHKQYEIEHEYTQWHGNYAEKYACRFMSKYKINPGIIETIKCMILYRIIDSDTREP